MEPTRARCSGSLQENGRYLKEARPTAVNLAWAVDRMLAVAERLLVGQGDLDYDLPREAAQALLAEANAIADEDVAVCRQIGAHGAELVPESANVLTHCNTGSLATVDYGTALGVIRAAHEAGKRPQRLRRRDPAVPPGRPPDRLGACSRKASRRR